MGVHIKLSYIYKATNKINGKSYIGKTINFQSRKKQHIHCAINKNSKSYFYNAIRKYGKENFIWSFLYKGNCSNYLLSQKEIYFIDLYGTFGKYGYNMSDGRDIIGKHPNKKEIIKKRIKNMSKINLETGLTKFQEVGLKSIKTMKEKINLETGLTKAQERAINQQKNMYKLNRYNEIGRKNSKILKKKFKDKTKHPRAKKYLLIAPNGQLIGAFGNFKDVCKKYNLSSRILGYFLNNGIVNNDDNQIKNTFRVKNTIGWQIIKLAK